MAAKRSNWTEVKKQVTQLEQKEIIKLLADLYKLSSENKRFFDTRFVESSDSLKPYKKMIESALYPNVMRDENPDFKSARHVISTYKKAGGRLEGLAELMILYVETANRFTVEYGDMWEQFYVSVETMFKNCIKQLEVLKNNGIGIDGFIDRLEEVVISANGIGWGYYDTLKELFYEAYGE